MKFKNYIAIILLILILGLNNKIIGSTDQYRLILSPDKIKFETRDNTNSVLHEGNNWQLLANPTQNWLIAERNDLQIPAERSVRIISAEYTSTEGYILVDNGYDDDYMNYNISDSRGLTAQPVEINVDEGANEVVLSISSYQNWEVSAIEGNSWLKVSTLDGENGDNLTISVDPNYTGNERWGSIEIDNGYNLLLIPIVQELGAYIHTSFNQIPFYTASEIIDLTITTNNDWYISHHPSGVALDVTSGVAGESVIAVDLVYTTENQYIEITSGGLTKKIDILYTREIQSNLSYNFTQTIVPTEASGTMGSYTASSTQFTYQDNMGRTMQEVSVGASTAGDNLVRFDVRDEFNRIDKKYMPFVSSTSDETGFFVDDPIAEQEAFYTNLYGSDDAERAFTEKIFNNSPSDKITEVIPNGKVYYDDVSGNHHSEKIAEDLNTLSDAVFNITCINNGFTVNSYAANQLYKKTNTNVDGNITETYIRQDGKIVLVRKFNEGVTHNNYSVYDDFGRKIYAIPAELELAEGTYYDSDTDVDNYCYIFKYNEKGLLEQQKDPGIDWVYFYYNDELQLVARQDGEMRNANMYYVTVYNENKKIISDGIFDNTTANYTTAQLVTVDFNSEADYNKMHEYFYHNYAFANAASFIAYKTDTEASLKTYNLATGKKTKVIGTSSWLTETYFYNDNGQLIQTYRDGYLNTSNRVHILYNFIGKTIETYQNHTNNGVSTELVYTFNYDHAHRLTHSYCQVNNQAQVLVEQLNYNELGQVIERNLHSDDNGVNYLQSLDFVYNIQGMLTKINTADITNSSDGDLFGMEMKYFDYYDIQPDDIKLKPTETPDYKANYSGLVSSVKWKSEKNTQVKGYTFTYDGLNRLTSATYGHHNVGWTGDTGYKQYSVPIIEYSKNGNITKLKRYTFASSTATLMDDLRYDYTETGNQLRNVYDSGNDITGFEEFKEGNLTNDTEYTYNSNGCLTSDLNKGITQITYNHLNLPQTVTNASGTLENVYSADGEKLFTTVTEGNTTTTQYAQGFLYRNSVLEQVSTGFGRLTPVAGAFRFDYHIKDYNGNNRVMFTKSTSGEAEVLQENHYYPFGLQMNGQNYFSGVNNPYRYSGKEYKQEIGLNWIDYGARLFDPALGRWHVPDAAKQFASPYVGLGNNPINGTDPDGNIWVFFKSYSIGSGWSSGEHTTVFGEWVWIPIAGSAGSHTTDGVDGGTTGDVNSSNSGGSSSGGGSEDNTSILAANKASKNHLTTIQQYNNISNDEWYKMTPEERMGAINNYMKSFLADFDKFPEHVQKELKQNYPDIFGSLDIPDAAEIEKAGSEEVDGAHFYDERGNKLGQLEVGTNWPLEVYLVKNGDISGFKQAFSNVDRHGNSKSNADRWNGAMLYSERANINNDLDGNYYLIPPKRLDFWLPVIFESALGAYSKVKLGGNGPQGLPNGFYEPWIKGIKIEF